MDFIEKLKEHSSFTVGSCWLRQINRPEKPLHATHLKTYRKQLIIVNNTRLNTDLNIHFMSIFKTTTHYYLNTHFQ